MAKGNIVGLAKVLIKDIGFIIKSVEQDLLYGRMEIDIKASSCMTKCMEWENTTVKMG